jgi:AraC-like DNA-binding protein
VVYECPTLRLMTPLPQDETPPHDDWRVIKIRKLLSANHGRTDVASLTLLSGGVGLTPAHLGRVFKTVTGVNFREYCVKSRINCSTTLLLQTCLSVKEIAATLGYKHVSDFVHAFKRQTGSTPGAFRRIGRARLCMDEKRTATS